MNKNSIFLLSENKEDIFCSPKEDLLCLFSQSNDCAQKINENDINHEEYVYPRYLTIKKKDFPAPIFIADSASSSLDIAHYLIQKNMFPAFASTLCRSQTTGRGQLRRNWASPEGNIYAALCLPNIPPFSTEAAAPALGGIIAHALNKMGYNVFLKWPNDIIQKQANNQWVKVAGILLEERHDTLVAGIGINIDSAPNKSELRKDYFIEAGILQSHVSQDNIDINIQNIYTCIENNSTIFNNYVKNIKEINIESSRKNGNKYNDSSMINGKYIATWHLWLTLVEQIFLWYKQQVLKTNTIPWQSITQQYLAFTGETVKIYHPIIKENSYQKEMSADFIVGLVSGINSHGELLLQTKTGILTILGGTFSQENNE